MKYPTQENTIKKLIPVLSKKEKEDILAYFHVYEKYAKEFSEKATEDLKEHPVFGKIIKDVPKEVSQARSKLSRQLQKDAIENDNWLPYVDYQIGQGIMYAKMGLDFKSWFEVVSLVKDYLLPYLHKEYSNEDKFLASLSGMNLFMDIAMGIIGEAYIQEKNTIIQQLNEELEQKVIRRTAQLESVNKELEAFTYSVSHDLRAPLRAISGYAEMLHEDYGSKLDSEGKRIIDSISYNAVKMGTLIDDLLTFSRLGRQEVKKTMVDMNELTKGVLSELNKSTIHSAKINTGKLHSIYADYGLIHQVMFNLISNAVKYSSKKKKPVVEIFSAEQNGEIIFTVKDNGAGFNMKYADKLFGVFQRLHSQEEFEGTGVGLAIVHRLIIRHGGKVWGEGKVNEGAVFNFSLTKN